MGRAWDVGPRMGGLIRGPWDCRERSKRVHYGVNQCILGIPVTLGHLLIWSRLLPMVAGVVIGLTLYCLG